MPPPYRVEGEAGARAEPDPHIMISGEDLDNGLSAMADFADLKSPYLLGHSRGVARLAAAAAERTRLPSADVAALRGAALLHDLGRVGVSNSVWDKPARLADDEWERVRLHAYYSERILSRSETSRRLVRSQACTTSAWTAPGTTERCYPPRCEQLHGSLPRRTCTRR